MNNQRREIHLLHIITGLQGGGAERFLLRLIPRLAEEGVTSSVISLTNGGDLDEEFKRAGIEVTCLDLSPGPISLFAIPRLARLIATKQPGIVLTWLHHADLLGTVSSRLAGYRRVIWNLRCSDMFANDHRWSSWPLNKAHSFLSRYPAAIISNSRAGEDFHRKAGYRAKHWEHIPNSIDTDYFSPKSSARDAIRSELGIKNDDKVICHAARAHPMKDHQGFLKAALPVLTKNDSVHVMLAGAGVEAAATEHLTKCPPEVARRVHFLGSRNDMADVYSSADLFCLSSIYGEGFPNVVAEAMACGLPCVATDVGDAARIIGETGRVVPPGKPEMLSAALEEILTMPQNMSNRMGEEARLSIIERYQPKQVVESYVRLFNSILNNGLG
ncbi:glycosyltransferase [Thalassospiraceae bacterium LMO-JJ14]|nr:glycosyltransferase [Thalassospiraceae bacterium LMO-JJ14]